jgi:hypothetical protein
MIQIQTVRMFTIFDGTKLHLSECNGSWVVSTELNMNFYIQPSSMFAFSAFRKNGLMKSCSYVEDLSAYKICHTLTGANLRPPQKFRRPGLWSGWRYEIKKVVPKVTFGGMISLLNLIDLLIGFEIYWVNRWTQTDRQPDLWIIKPVPFLMKIG